MKTATTRLVGVISASFTAPLWLMWSLRGFHQPEGYWTCFWMCAALDTAISASLWSLRTYLQIGEPK
jgi:hypothetical protein